MKLKSTGIASWPKTERQRERLLAERAENLTEAELLAIILLVVRAQGLIMNGVVEYCAGDLKWGMLPR